MQFTKDSKKKFKSSRFKKKFKMQFTKDSKAQVNDQVVVSNKQNMGETFFTSNMTCLLYTHLKRRRKILIKKKNISK